MPTLVERVMNENVSDSERIPVHIFFAALTRVNSGRWTAQQVKTAFNMNGQDGSDFNWFVSKLSSISDENVRINKLNELESIFILAEAGWVPNHQTAAEVQSEIFNLLN